MKRIGDRAIELMLSKKTEGVPLERALSDAAILLALNEFQTEVDARLAEIEQHPALSIPALRKPLTKPRRPFIPPTPVDESGQTDPASEAERERVNADTRRYNASRYQPDPEPHTWDHATQTASGYDREPTESEE